MSCQTGKLAKEKGGSSQNSFNAFDISCLRPHFNVAEKCNFLRRQRRRRRCRRHFCHGPIKMMHNFIGFISVKIETRGEARLETDGNNEACCLRLSCHSAIAHTPCATGGSYAKCVYPYIYVLDIYLCTWVCMLHKLKNLKQFWQHCALTFIILFNCL